MIPFLVVDRPASLRIIKGVEPSGKIGLMSHANASPLFKKLFKLYPCGENPCHAIDPQGKTPCPDSFNSKFCKYARERHSNIIKICDCGMFTKEGANFTYEQLFSIYNTIDADYGVMLDVYRDSMSTIASAKEAVKIYNENSYKFNLILVAQGNTIDEYVSCYEKLLSLGCENIAIGGLLKRRINTARYVDFRGNSFMSDVLQKIRQEFDPNWLFALGCYHPKRHFIFERFNVWGSDYKGWIFQYKKRERLIQSHWEIILKQLEKISADRNPLIADFKSSIKQRSSKLVSYEKSEYKRSRRNLSISDRDSYFIRSDDKLVRALSKIILLTSLNGTSNIIESELESIIGLSATAEQQIRFNQLRNLISNLMTNR